MFTNLNIGKRLYVGFGAICFLLLVTSVVAVYSLKHVSDIFTDYRSLARSSNALGSVETNLLNTRLNVKDFIISGNQQSIDKVRERATATINSAKDSVDLAVDANQADIVSNVATRLEGYAQKFEEVVSLQEKRNEIVFDELNVNGAAMRKDLQTIMTSAYNDGDPQAAYYAGQSMTHLMLARLYAQKYLITNDSDDAARSRAEFEEMIVWEKQLLANLENPVRRELAEKVDQAVTGYRQAFEAVYETISNRNTIIVNELDVIGPSVALATEETRLGNKAQQDIIGPQSVIDIENSINLSLAIAAIAIVLAIIAAYKLGRSITGPIENMTGAMLNLAEGDTTTDIPSVGQKDEVGQMANAVQVFKDNMLKNRELAEQQEAERQKREERSNRVNELTYNFDTGVIQVLEAVSSASTQMRTTADSMTETAGMTANKAGEVATASEQTSSNVQTVASATDELVASISEISSQTKRSAEITSRAVDEANKTREEIGTLEQSSDKIGQVVSLINDIAEQTTLLALNATIEAARAGDAGKGFAVVASEVKNLANQTSHAIEEISEQVASVQAATGSAVMAIKSITDTIKEVDEITTGISAAVEEQGASTQEIARNVEQASRGVEHVNNNIVNVSHAAKDSGQAANEVLQVSSEVANRSDELQKMVKTFLTEVKTA